jgi:hypothetical protein
MLHGRPGTGCPSYDEEVSRKMRDTAGGTPALPFEEAAPSFSSPNRQSLLFNHSPCSRPFAFKFSEKSTTGVSCLLRKNEPLWCGKAAMNC